MMKASRRQSLHGLLLGFAAMLCGMAGAAEIGVANRPDPGPALDAVLAERVAPGLLQRLARGGRGDFVIEFRERADLSPAFAMDWQERGHYVARVLRETAERSQAEVRAALTAAGVMSESYWIKNVMLVRQGDLAAARVAAGYSQVARIFEPPEVSLIQPDEQAASGRTGLGDNIAWVGADQVWAQGTSGSGVTVGIIDTGVRYTHEAIVGQYRGNSGDGTFEHDYNWRGPFVAPTTPDQSIHATHVIGTIVGDNRHADPDLRQRIGMAPGARWMACHGLRTDVFDPELVLLECGQFMLAPTRSNGSDPDPDKRPQVVNNSWGEINCDGTATGFYADVVEAWVAAGIFPVFAAGNASNCGLPEPPGLSTVTSPASLGSAFTIGSSGNHDGQYAPHSLWGPTTDAAPGLPDYPDPGGYPQLKPQVVAPGVAVRSAAVDDDYGYAALTGTSMAAPHITGLVALMLDAGACLAGDYATLGGIIMQTARPMPYDTGGQPSPGPGNVPNYATGWGEIDAPAAVDAAAAACGPTGTVRGTVVDKQGVPVAGATVEFVTVSGAVHQTTTEADGSFVRRLPVDTADGHDVHVSRYGYLPANETGVLVYAGQTTVVNLVLAAAPRHRVAGRVFDAATGWPLHARIIISGAPLAPVWSDPVSGDYAVDLPEGMAFHFDVTSEIDGYRPQALALGAITAGTDLDFALQADLIACSAPGYAYTETRFSEDFSSASGPPPGWDASSAGMGWLFGTAGELSSPNFQPPEHGRFAAANDELGAGDGWDNDGRFDYLITPSMDLTGLQAAALTYLSFHDHRTLDGFGESRSPASVQASTDGGQSWVLLGAPTRTRFDQGWTTEALDLTPVIGPDVLIRFHADDLSDGGPFGALGSGWAIDDVAVRGGCTPPAQGGLIIGQVRDANTQAALNGAEVQIDGGRIVRTGDNAGIGPGFFALYAGGDADQLAAWPGAELPAGYGAVQAPLAVADGAVVRQDVLLPAGRLQLYPAGPAASLELGTTTTATFTVSNTGTLPLTFGFEGEAVEEHFETAFPPPGWAVETIGTDCAWTWLDNSQTQNTAGGDGRAAMVDAQFCADGSAADTALITESFDLSDSSTAAMGFFLAFRVGDSNQARLDVEISTDDGNTWTTVFTETEFNSGFGPGNLIEIDLTPFAGAPAARARFRYRTYMPWVGVTIDQVHLFSTINANEMLNLAPDTGSLQAGESLQVQAVFDAGNIAQPGVHTVPIRVVEDTPYPSTYGDVMAVMTVTAPASYGAVTGRVHGLSRCDSEAIPLIGAGVRLEDANGAVFTTTTDPQGGYTYWLDAAQGPFNLTVEADGYLSATQQVALLPGEESVADMGLRLLASCLGVDTAKLEATVPPGGVEDHPIELLNSGPVESAWHIRAGGDPEVLTPATLAQTHSPDLEQFMSFACINPGADGLVLENRYFRIFPMADHNHAREILGITFGIDSAEADQGAQPLTVRLYTLEGDFVLANLSLLAEQTVSVADTELARFSVAFDQAVSPNPDARVVAELYVPEGLTDGNRFYPGGNGAGQSATAYHVAAGCGWEEPQSYTELGMDWIHLVLELDILASDPCGDAATPVPWLTFEPDTGNIAGDSSLPITATLDAAGNAPGSYRGTACLAEGDASHWMTLPAWMHIGQDGADLIFLDRFE